MEVIGPFRATYAQYIYDEPEDLVHWILNIAQQVHWNRRLQDPDGNVLGVPRMVELARASVSRTARAHRVSPLRQSTALAQQEAAHESH